MRLTSVLSMAALCAAVLHAQDTRGTLLGRVTDASGAPESTVMDETHKVAVTRLGDRIRVGGTAELAGYTLKLHEARSLEEALACAAQAPLDLVLINLELPGPNGIEATRALRRRHPQCPVIVMSVNDSEALRTAAWNAGSAPLFS